MINEFKKNIVRFLKRSEPGQNVNLNRIARELDVSPDDYEAFKEAFEELRSAGHIVSGHGSSLELSPLKGQITGKYRANRQGFGFVMPLEGQGNEDLFIGKGDELDAVTGDTVLAKVQSKRKRGGRMLYSGIIVKVVERGKSKFVGTLTKTNKGWIVQPDGKDHFDVISVDTPSVKGAKEKDKVVVEVIQWPDDKHLASGVIVQVLGRTGKYETEIAAVIEQFNLPVDFSDSSIAQARKAAVDFEEMTNDGREDITDKVIATIDPTDSKDFDDAISIERDKQGNFVLGIHIADVSTFVEVDSALDEEASERGNSVYLPGRVIPMLPEILSNGICSLMPDQRRFAKSVYITYDKSGTAINRRYANSVMKSTQRLNYLQADAALKGKPADVKPTVMKLLKDMETLAKMIEQRRHKAGMLHLDLPETDLIFDEAGMVVDAKKADDSYPHTIIEMFMVEANDSVAILLDSKKVAFMRRIHPAPDAASFKELSTVLKSIGYSFPKNGNRFDLQSLLDAVKGTDASFAVNMFVLRSLERAEYSPRNVGHFALAGRHYCHFTSPIRRYADLLVHRQLQEYIEHGDIAESESSQDETLSQIGMNISFTERRAAEAENDLKAVLLLQMMSKRVGDIIDCVVTGLASFGAFVKCKKFGIEGLIPTEQMKGDTWEYNKKGHFLMGRQSGAIISLGMPMKAKVVTVDIAARKLTMAPAQELVSKDKQKKAKGKSSKKASAQGHKKSKWARKKNKGKRR